MKLNAYARKTIITMHPCINSSPQPNFHLQFINEWLISPHKGKEEKKQNCINALKKETNHQVKRPE